MGGDDNDRDDGDDAAGAEPGRGRPRSEQARRAILDATRDLVAESGYQQLTVQAVAARAGTGRQTVYRWWTSKALLVAELVTNGEVSLPSAPVPDSGDLQADLAAWLDGIMTAMADTPSRSLLLALVTAASVDEAATGPLYEVTTAPLHRELVDRLRRGHAHGQVGDHSDVVAVADALIGTVLFRAFTPDAPTPAARSVVRTLLGHPSPAPAPGRAPGTGPA